MAEENFGGISSTRKRNDNGKRPRESYESEPTQSSPCGACKFLRRKCLPECIFAPYFTSDQAAALFAAVHKVFGASNVSKLLMHLPEHWRQHAVATISYEAQARLSDPIYGCVATIVSLTQQVEALQAELAAVQNRLMNNRFVISNALRDSLLQPVHQPENNLSASLQPVHHPELLQPENGSSASLQPVDRPELLQQVYSKAASAFNDNYTIDMNSFDSGASNLAGGHESAVHLQPSFNPSQLSRPCYEDENDCEKQSENLFDFLDQML